MGHFTSSTDQSFISWHLSETCHAEKLSLQVLQLNRFRKTNVKLFISIRGVCSPRITPFRNHSKNWYWSKELKLRIIFHISLKKRRKDAKRMENNRFGFLSWSRKTCLGANSKFNSFDVISTLTSRIHFHICLGVNCYYYYYYYFFFCLRFTNKKKKRKLFAFNQKK